MEGDSYQADDFQLYEKKIFFYGIAYPIRKYLIQQLVTGRVKNNKRTYIFIGHI